MLLKDYPYLEVLVMLRSGFEESVVVSFTALFIKSYSVYSRFIIHLDKIFTRSKKYRDQVNGMFFQEC